MVSDDFDSFRDSFEIMLPLLEGSKYGEKLFVIDFVVEFCRGHGTGEKCNRMEKIASRIDLGEDRCYRVVGSIGFDNSESSRVIVRENRG